MTELSNPLYGSLSINDENSLRNQCKNLQKDYNRFFDDIVSLSKSDILNATHKARKTLKSYRAFVKLLKNCPGVYNYKGANYLLRDLGKIFSDLRDSHVREILLKELNSRLKSEFLKVMIKKNLTEIEQQEKVIMNAANYFDELRKTVSTSAVLDELLNESDIQKTCITEGITSSFNKSEKAFNECSNSETEEAYHEWRKRLKDLLNQLKLFKDEKYLESDKRFSNIDQLCEEMGMLNDMAMLKKWIEETISGHNKINQDKELIIFLDDNINELQQRLLTSGEQFYLHPEYTLNELKSLISDE